jgi:hypothetical protein
MPTALQKREYQLLRKFTHKAWAKMIYRAGAAERVLSN